MARAANADRAGFGKLQDPDLLAELQALLDACERAMPPANLVIDTETVAAEAAAGMIAAKVA